MPRINYINKVAYKAKKRKLEEQTKGFVDNLNKKLCKEAARQKANA